MIDDRCSTSKKMQGYHKCDFGCALPGKDIVGFSAGGQATRA